MYIVNWYPASFGDRIIVDLFNTAYTITDTDSYKLPYNGFLKFPENYNLPLEKFKSKFINLIVPDLLKYNVVGSHRFNKVDFKNFLPEVKVISIDPTNCIDLVVDAFFQKVQGHHRPEFDNPIITKLVNNNKLTYAKLYKQKLINRWKEVNILNSDLIFNLNQYFQDPNYPRWFKNNVMS